MSSKKKLPLAKRSPSLTGFTAVVLAAGKGERMKSPRPKVLHDLLGKPLIYYVLREVLSLKKYIEQVIVIVGYKGEIVAGEVKKYLSANELGRSLKPKIRFVYQPRMLGTANAVEVSLKAAKCANILVTCGDVPLITRDLLQEFMALYLQKKSDCQVLTAVGSTDNALGVVLRDKKGKIKSIRERINFSPDLTTPLASCEINSGTYCFKKEALRGNLPRIKKQHKKKEYFLTDIVEILYQQGRLVDTHTLNTVEEVSGINTQFDLSEARKVMQKRILHRLAGEGVKIIDFQTTLIEEGVKIGQNSIIYPFTFIEKGAIIGHHCSLGPFTHIRGKTSIGNYTQIGNFVEVNRSIIGRNVKIKHFGYLGDAVIEDNVNIGAGTVTANFDGKTKHKTCIKKGAFIGSDTVLVAPVKVDEDGVTGAGSVVTRDVKAKTVVVGIPARVLRKKKG